MKIVFTVLILALCRQLSAQDELKIKETTPLTIGETIEFRSEILNEARKINVYLPYGYSEDSSKIYPVIYLLDGSLDEDLLHIAGLVQFASFPWIKMVPESIVVGISNVDRKRDFTFPTRNARDKSDFPTSGGSEDFMTFIEKELQPVIEKTYNTSTTKTLIGQSLGGLLATEIVFKTPDLFDNYIIVSPSLWWDDESLLLFKPAEYKTEKFVYIAVGKEGEVMERTAKELYDKLQASKGDNTTLYFDFLEEQNHGDALHLAVYDAFEKIFRDKNE